VFIASAELAGRLFALQAGVALVFEKKAIIERLVFFVPSVMLWA